MSCGGRREAREERYVGWESGESKRERKRESSEVVQRREVWEPMARARGIEGETRRSVKKRGVR